MLAVVDDGLTIGVRAALARGAAARSIDPGDLAGLVHEVDGLLPDNGVDEPFGFVQDLLARGEVVDVLGTVSGTGGLHVALVDDSRSGARMLAMLRHGGRRDVAAEQFFTDVAVAAGAEDLVVPMALLPGRRAALTQLVPHRDLAAQGLDDVSAVERALARGYEAEGFGAPGAALREARTDVQLAAALDSATGHADRNLGNALVEASQARLTLIDHELIGGGAYHGATEGVLLLASPLQGGRPSRIVQIEGDAEQLVRVDLERGALDILADLDRSAVLRAHARLATSPPPRIGDDMAAYIRSDDYLDSVIARFDSMVDDGGWEYLSYG